MKRVLAAAFLALSSSAAFSADVVQPVVEEPIVAGPRVSGHVEAYLGGLWLDAEGGNQNAWVAGGAARLNYPIDARWNIQGDLFADGAWFDEGDLNSYGGALHAYWRDPNSFALGAFTSVTGYGGDVPSGYYSFAVGPEAQVYLDNLTLYGQVYYSQLRNSNISDHADIWGGRAVARYFAQPNLRFDGEVGYRSLDVINGGTDVVTLAFQANYRFDNTPWTVFGRYQFDHLSADNSDANLHKLVVGVRATFGADTLMDEDRNGATMDTPRSSYLFF